MKVIIDSTGVVHDISVDAEVIGQDILMNGVLYGGFYLVDFEGTAIPHEDMIVNGQLIKNPDYPYISSEDKLRLKVEQQDILLEEILFEILPEIMMGGI